MSSPVDDQIRRALAMVQQRRVRPAMRDSAVAIFVHDGGLASCLNAKSARAQRWIEAKPSEVVGVYTSEAPREQIASDLRCTLKSPSGDAKE